MNSRGGRCMLFWRRVAASTAHQVNPPVLGFHDVTFQYQAPRNPCSRTCRSESTATGGKARSAYPRDAHSSVPFAPPPVDFEILVMGLLVMGLSSDGTLVMRLTAFSRLRAAAAASEESISMLISSPRLRAGRAMQGSSAEPGPEESDPPVDGGAQSECAGLVRRRRSTFAPA